MIYPKIINNFSYILNQKTSNVINKFIIFLIISFIVFILIIYNFEYNLNKKYFGYVKQEEKFYVYSYILEKDINEIINSILCNDNKFKIINISDTLILDNNKFREIKIEIKLAKQELINNNVIELNFNLGKTTLIKEIRKEINGKIK